MSTATAVVSPDDKSRTRAVRIALVTVALVVLLVLSFAIGHATATTTHKSPSVVPTAGAPDTECRVGIPC